MAAPSQSSNVFETLAADSCLECGELTQARTSSGGVVDHVMVLEYGEFIWKLPWECLAFGMNTTTDDDYYLVETVSPHDRMIERHSYSMCLPFHKQLLLDR
jgi:hypothetical protein